MTLYENLYQNYKALQGTDYKGGPTVSANVVLNENYRNALIKYRSAHKFLRLDHILRNLAYSYKAGK